MAGNYAMNYACGTASEGESCTPYYILRDMIVTASKGLLAPTASIEAQVRRWLGSVSCFPLYCEYLDTHPSTSLQLNYLKTVEIHEADYPILHVVLPYLSLNFNQSAPAMVVSCEMQI